MARGTVVDVSFFNLSTVIWRNPGKTLISLTPRRRQGGETNITMIIRHVGAVSVPAYMSCVGRRLWLRVVPSYCFFVCFFFFVV